MMRSLEDRVEELTRENQRLKSLGFSDESENHSSPTSIDYFGEASFLTPTHFGRKPRVILDVYNKCAKAILDHKEQKLKWRACNYLDDPILSKKIKSLDHYLFHAKQSHARYSNGRMINCLSKMR